MPNTAQLRRDPAEARRKDARMVTGLNLLRSDRAEDEGPFAWAEPLRERGRRRFAAAGLPSRRLEAWKYTDLSPLGAIPFRSPTEEETQNAQGLPQALGGAEDATNRLVFVHGRLRPDVSRMSRPPHGLRLAGMRDARRSDGALLARHLGRIADLDAQPLVALNTASSEDGCMIHIAAGTKIEEPIEVSFVGGHANDPLVYNPRVLVVLEDGASASVIERHVGIGSGSYFANVVTEVCLGTGAHLRHYKLQAEGANAWHVTATTVHTDNDAVYDTFSLSMGARLARQEISVRLARPGARCAVTGAYLVRDRQHCDTTTRIEHLAQQTSCEEVFKGVLDEAARGVFQGTIIVHRGAHGADARQLSKALLLSDAAEVDQKPELEIYDDDVKCSHGAAVGELDRDALFYLRSRGLSEAAARRLLIEGFLLDAFERIADDCVRTPFLAAAVAWLRT